MSRYRYLILSGTHMAIIFTMILLIKLAVLPGLVTGIVVAVLSVFYFYILTQMGKELNKTASRPNGKL